MTACLPNEHGVFAAAEHVRLAGSCRDYAEAVIAEAPHGWYYSCRAQWGSGQPGDGGFGALPSVRTTPAPTRRHAIELARRRIIEHLQSAAQWYDRPRDNPAARLLDQMRQPKLFADAVQ